VKTQDHKTQDARRKKVGRRRTDDGLLEAAARVLNEVAALSDPHVGASVIQSGYSMQDHWHVARLRSIAAARIAALGYRSCHIARVFNQGWVTTHNQILNAPRLAGHPRFTQYFPPDDPDARRVDCGSGQHYGICTRCGHGHGYVMLPATSTE